MDKKRILIIENSRDVTGALKSITRTAYDLEPFFSTTFVIPSGSKGRAWIEAKGFTDIVELPMKELNRNPFRLLIYLPYLFYNSLRVSRIARRKQIDLIHSNDLYNLIPVVLRACCSRIPYVCHIRFLPDKFPAFLFSFWLKLHFRYASKVVTVSQFLKKRLPEHPKIDMIHNELPVEERYAINAFHPDTPTLLYLSNIIPGKGHQYALAAFKKVSSDFRDWKLRFVGGVMGMRKNEKYRRELQELARNLNISDQVEWVDFAEDVEREYKQAKIVLNFSESESFSITCLEALYFGRPAIATDCGGPAEIIDHNHTGLLVKNHDVDGMADAMRRLMNDELLRDSFGAEARQRVRVKFSVEKTSLRVKEIYDQILRQAG